MDRFERLLKKQISKARKEYSRYKKRNKVYANGGLVDDYCDEDWSSLFVSESKLFTLELVLSHYLEIKREEYLKECLKAMK